MKIDKKKFNKLKQLDRIEFRQKWDRIENLGFSVINLVFISLIIFSIFFSASILSQNILEKVSYSLINFAIKFFILSIFMWFIEIVLLIGFSIRKNNLKKELFEEYFSVEVKSK